MTDKSGGPAFPQNTVYIAANGDVAGSGPQGGATLRDYFAAKAMQAYIGSCPMGTPDWRDLDQWAPSKAYEMADAMLDARK